MNEQKRIGVDFVWQILPRYLIYKSLKIVMVLNFQLAMMGIKNLKKGFYIIVTGVSLTI